MAVRRLKPFKIMIGRFCVYRIIRLNVYVTDWRIGRRHVVRNFVSVYGAVSVVVYREDPCVGMLPTVVDTEKTHQVTL